MRLDGTDFDLGPSAAGRTTLFDFRKLAQHNLRGCLLEFNTHGYVSNLLFGRQLVSALCRPIW